jgi:Polyketide cyclase / dehydrase and lipid transport
MASIRKEIIIDAHPDDVWDALRDWGALHERLVPGFIVDTRLEGPDRVITLFDDTVLRERFVGVDEETRRLVWTIVDGPYAHHNSSAQVIAHGPMSTSFVWIADVLPDEVAGRTGELMERGIGVIKRTLET